MTLRSSHWSQLAAFGPCLLLACVLATPGVALGQAFEWKWLAGGSLVNWYANIGSEKEEGRALVQQDGLRWPAYRDYQDMQCAKALWIGVKNFTDPPPSGTTYERKVIHVGPRVGGFDSFFPVKFELVTRYRLPVVTVDGSTTTGEARMAVNRVDPDLVPDVMIDNVVNTGVGITMERKIMQFSQQYHDNYIISDYTFTNTGNIDADTDIEMPNVTLTDVYIYFQWRLSVCWETRYVIGNATGWGINAMLDTRGDGVKNDADDAVDVPGVYSSPHMRIQYVWHGKYPPFTTYDNLGGPVWQGYYDKADSIGRLGAAQFVGAVTLHCDTSPTDTTDDFNQPVTTSWEGSDEPNTIQNDDFNGPRMMQEYEGWIKRGHRTPRQADVVEPSGAFNEPKGDPSLGTPGGFSNANGYGPFTLAPGQSIRIVWAEGASGLSQEKCVSVGRQFKAGLIAAKAKNDSVLTGKDSLFQTFRRAIANFKSGYQIPRGPMPPKTFDVTSGGDKVTLSWTTYDEETTPLKGFRLYRAVGRWDGEYTLIHEAGPTDRQFDDLNVTRGFANYYYIQAVGDASANNGGGLTPPGELASARIYSQAYDPAFLQRPAGNAAGPNNMDSIRIVPNPYSLKLTAFPGEQDKIAFYNIPGYCTIRIYTEMGELIQEIENTTGRGDAYWNSITSSRQVVVSGIYIVVIDNHQTGQRVIKKLSIIR